MTNISYKKINFNKFDFYLRGERKRESVIERGNYRVRGERPRPTCAPILGDGSVHLSPAGGGTWAVWRDGGQYCGLLGSTGRRAAGLPSAL